MALAAASCQSPQKFDIGLASATPIEYGRIRDASGVLGYAEPMLGPGIATRNNVPVGPGASLVETGNIAGVWELPPAMKAADVAASLTMRGTLDRVREYRNGAIWIGDFSASDVRQVRLMMIDGNNPEFEKNAVPEVRPGPHIYLIVYRKP